MRKVQWQRQRHRCRFLLTDHRYANPVGESPHGNKGSRAEIMPHDDFNIGTDGKPRPLGIYYIAPGASRINVKAVENGGMALGVEALYSQLNAQIGSRSQQRAVEASVDSFYLVD